MTKHFVVTEDSGKAIELAMSDADAFMTCIYIIGENSRDPELSEEEKNKQIEFLFKSLFNQSKVLSKSLVEMRKSFKFI
jgi:hypothetical protein